ncbi:hypothetical protein EJ04DRAFT_564965 [Polyplosphaeria fusca]|uniref:Gamma-glutamylcyclotransferase AIG2-like domain-containing protein n=1 Tax=Polyplosphaeria fusca TaxID=682080 RepID=A0A9P4UYU8_9PLEO|nr:hypothetical protein EJ04DRAFT_564965 [Polyplosphaeria fusca]
MTDRPQKQVHPEDVRLYCLAYTNRWTMQEMRHLTAWEVPIFIYCPLMLPWVMSTVLEVPDRALKGAEDMAKLMTPATLRNYVRPTIMYTHRPTAVQSTGDVTLEGFLFAGVSSTATERIEFYIGLEDHSRATVEVEIELDSLEKVLVAAYVYVWKGPASLLLPQAWDPVEYMLRVTTDER